MIEFERAARHREIAADADAAPARLRRIRGQRAIGDHGRPVQVLNAAAVQLRRIPADCRLGNQQGAGPLINAAATAASSGRIVLNGAVRDGGRPAAAVDRKSAAGPLNDELPLIVLSITVSSAYDIDTPPPAPDDKLLLIELRSNTHSVAKCGRKCRRRCYCSRRSN